jgi:cytochrome c5
MVEMASAKRDLMVAVSGAGPEFEQAVAGVKEDLLAAVEVLLQRAQAVGAARPDVEAAAVLSLTSATCHAAAQAGAVPTSELLTIVCDGLRSSG